MTVTRSLERGAKGSSRPLALLCVCVRQQRRSKEQWVLLFREQCFLVVGGAME